MMTALILLFFLASSMATSIAFCLNIRSRFIDPGARISLAIWVPKPISEFSASTPSDGSERSFKTDKLC